MSDMDKHVVKPKSAAHFESLTFTLGTDEFGIDLQCVQELCGYAAVTALADTPVFIKGLMALRGMTIPVIDLRLRLNLGQPVYDQFTVVIIVKVDGQTAGLVVDRVADVIEVQTAQIKPVKPLASSIALDYLLGVCMLKDRGLILIDIRKFLLSCDPDMLWQLDSKVARP